MQYRGIRNLKEKVEKILSEDVDSRNSDITLMIELWVRYCSNYIDEDSFGFKTIRLKHLYELPREDAVKRVRAHIQNDLKKYLPTIEDVAIARRLNIDEWRVAMGYPTQSTAGTNKPSWQPPSEIVI